MRIAGPAIRARRTSGVTTRMRVIARLAKALARSGLARPALARLANARPGPVASRRWRTHSQPGSVLG